jgi:hypothetical protein
VVTLKENSQKDCLSHSIYINENPWCLCLIRLGTPLCSGALVSQIQTGGSKDVGRREYMNDIHFHPMLYTRCIMDKRNHLQLLSLPSREPFLHCLDQIWVHLLVVLDDYKASYWSIDG